MVLVSGNLSLTSKIILIPTLSFTFFAGLTGNILVCIVIITNRVQKSATNGFILSLAVADVLVCGVTVPIALLSLFQNPRSLAALLAGELALSTVSCSLLQLAVISFDRYRGIVHPEKPRLAWKHLKYVIPPLWLIAIAETCIVVFSWKTNVWVALLHFVWFWLIATITVICYALIWRRVINHNKEVSHTLGDNQEDRMKKERKSIMMIILVIGCLILCWAPVTIVYGIFIISTAQVNPLSPIMREPLNAMVAFGYFNSCVNPFIYAYMNKAFRTAFQDVFSKTWCYKWIAKHRPQHKQKVQIHPSSSILSTRKTFVSSHA